MKVLVTGAAGFVGTHLASALVEILGPSVAPVPTSRYGSDHSAWGSVERLDVTDALAVRNAISYHQPTHVINLAGIAAAKHASDDPQAAWAVHLHGALNLADAIMEIAPNCVLLNVGSGLVYGQTARCGQPLTEDAVLAPTDQYSVTKASAELALGALVTQGLRCIRMRPFNHTGPGQPPYFVVSSFAAQIARIEAGLTAPVIKVGNLNTQRDFLDVRDVVRAYALTIKKVDQLEPGDIINIASGKARSIREILDYLLDISRQKISIEQDNIRLRSSDLPSISGDASYAHIQLGWSPQYPFQKTLADVLEHCRSEIIKRRETG